MKFFDFRKFQKITRTMPSHEKIIFHTLYGAFHGASSTLLRFVHVQCYNEDKARVSGIFHVINDDFEA